MFGRGPQNGAPLLGTRPNISESHSEISITRVPFCIAGRNNIYWDQIACDAAAKCTFGVENVPEGNYAVWVRLPGALPLQQRVLPSVVVRAGATTKLGDLAVPSSLGERSGVLWQIGQVDASVAEYRFGALAEMHTWALWLELYQQKLLNASIDLGDLTNDCANRTGARADELPFMQPLLGDTVGARDVTTWTINWTGATPRSQISGRVPMKLLVGLSLAATLRTDRGMRYDIILNGQTLNYSIHQGKERSNTTSIFACPYVDGQVHPPATTHVDVRSGVRSGICPGVQLWATILPSTLRKNNVLALRLSGQTGSLACGSNQGGQPRVACPAAAVLYDFIRLEQEG